jgi:hypothetical protein
MRFLVHRIARLNEKDQIMRAHGLPAFDDFEAFEKHFLNKHGDDGSSVDDKDNRAEVLGLYLVTVNIYLVIAECG